MTDPARPLDALDALDHDAFEAKQISGIREWVAAHLDGETEEIVRLERWRPQWKVTYRDGNGSHVVLFRGNRPIAGEHDLRFEMEVMQVLEANGIQVPHIHGWVDFPKAFVMDWVETDDRAPGMVHTAIESPDTLDEARWQALLGYMEHLARIHEVPVREFQHIRQLSRPPRTAREIALHQSERMYRIGVHTGNNDTIAEFLQTWLRRNVPEHRTEARFIAGDAGQFMSAGTEVRAVMDFEIASIGDTHWDLACFRGRHPLENMGDIPALYRRYEEVSGREVDLRVVGYHTVAFLQLSGIAAKMFMNPETRGGNWIEGVLEYSSIMRRAFEAIAELQAIELDYDLRLPEPGIQDWEDSGLRKLLIDIERLPTSSAFQPWEKKLMGDIPRFLLGYARHRDWFEREAANEIGRVTGRVHASLAEADTALFEVIAEDDAARDELIVPILHRRLLRLGMILAGSDPDFTNPLFHKLDPILDRSGSTF
jgi:aminoglycoside phosphotransferase (APT) family kinase protein